MRRLIILIILIIFFGGVIFGVQKLIKSERKVEGELFLESIERLAKLDSFLVEGNFLLKLEGIKEKEFPIREISFKIDEKVDLKDKEEPKAKGKFFFDLLAEGITVSFGGEFIQIGKEFYLKITTLPPLGLIGDIISVFRENWLKIDLSKIEERIRKDKSFLKGDQEKLEKDMKNLFKKENFFLLEKKEEQEGKEEKMVHYLVSLDKKKLKSFLLNYRVLAQDYFSEKEFQQLNQSLEQILKEYDETIAPNIEKFKFDLLIGKRSHTLRKIYWKGAISLSELTKELKSPLEGRTEISLEFNFSQFNRKFEIEAPKEFLPIEDALKGIMPEILGGISPEIPVIKE